MTSSSVWPVSTDSVSPRQQQVTTDVRRLYPKMSHAAAPTHQIRRKSTPMSAPTATPNMQHVLDWRRMSTPVEQESLRSLDNTCLHDPDVHKRNTKATKSSLGEMAAQKLSHMAGELHVSHPDNGDKYENHLTISRVVDLHPDLEATTKVIQCLEDSRDVDNDESRPDINVHTCGLTVTGDKHCLSDSVRQITTNTRRLTVTADKQSLSGSDREYSSQSPSLENTASSLARTPSPENMSPSTLGIIERGFEQSHNYRPQNTSRERVTLLATRARPNVSPDDGIELYAVSLETPVYITVGVKGMYLVAKDNQLEVSDRQRDDVPGFKFAMTTYEYRESGSPHTPGPVRRSTRLATFQSKATQQFLFVGSDRNIRLVPKPSGFPPQASPEFMDSGRYRNLDLSAIQFLLDPVSDMGTETVVLESRRIQGSYMFYSKTFHTFKLTPPDVVDPLFDSDNTRFVLLPV